MSDSVLQRFGSFEMMAARYQDWQADFAESVQGGAVSFGNFDGVHLGHQALVEALVSHARKVHRPAVAILFDPHPRSLLEKGVDLKLLTTTEDRAILLKRQGLDEVIALQVDRQFLNLDAHSFFQRYFQFGFRPQWIVEGSNFHFGKQRTGDVHLLKKLAADSGIQVQIVPPVTYLDSEVSSSRIREALEKGDVGMANTLLGRPYFLRGKVQAGFKRGQTLGFPTANLGEIQTVIPMAGVYAARAQTENNDIFPAAVHVGPTPTFAGNSFTVEAHLIHFSGNLYHQALRLEFLHRLRDIRPFRDSLELTSQLTLDVQKVQKLTNNNGTK